MGEAFLEAFITMWNVGLFLALAFGLLILLRPVTNRLLSPQQRVCLWGIGWVCFWAYTPLGLLSVLKVLPLTLRDLVVTRTGGSRNVPAFLPPVYRGEGTYHIALPGGDVIPVGMTDALVTGLLLFGLAGTILLLWRSSRQEKRLAQMGKGEPPLKSGAIGLSWPDNVAVRLCPGLPTSFVRPATGEDRKNGARYEVCIQEELSPERRKLVLRHELTHIRLKHVWMKIYMAYGVFWAWWNPVIWLAYRLTCRDMELACDQAVLSELKEDQRREYAHTLVELGAGRYLWEEHLSFGECDAALRVRRAVAWKPWRWWVKALTWGLTALLALFLFTGGPYDQELDADLEENWARTVAAEDFWARAWPADELLPQFGELWWRLDKLGNEEHSRDKVILYLKEENGTWWRIEWFWIGRERQEYVRTGREQYPPGEVPDLTGCIRMEQNG